MKISKIDLQKESSSTKKLILLIFIAYTFSVAIRLIWVYQFSDFEQFKFNDQFMINTNDGYYWAEGARDILANITENTNDLSPMKSAASTLTAFIARILPVSFETIIFYMPAFFSSLLVIPIILIGRSIGKLEVGFIAALLASITWSYYNRTMVGYYDTDLLNIVLPTFFLWSLIWAIKIKEDKYILFTALDIVAYRWWYPQSYSLEFAFFGLILAYTIYLAIKEKSFQIQHLKFNITLLSFMMFAMMGLDSSIRFIVVTVLFIALKIKRELVEKYLYHLFSLSIVLFIATGGIDPIMGQLKGYVFKDAIKVTQDALSLHFFSVMQTIREAGQIPFETFANRISGDTITFIFSIIGYIWLVLKHRTLLLGLPMIGLGFLALSGGLRFTIYAIPVLALGIAFLIVTLTKLLNPKSSKTINYTLVTILTILVLLPNIKHIINYKVPTVFTKDEVIVLDKLKKIASREDYVVSWWDYGYPIRYYADVKTLSDGGKHSGSVNFPISFILTHPQEQAAKMLRLDVEYTEETFAINKLNLDKNRSNQIKRINNIAQMTLDYGYKDTNNFLTALKTDQLHKPLPKKTRDIYLYLPNRMLGIYPTVNLFSNIDLMTGLKGKQPFFYKSVNYRENKNFIDLGHGIKIDKNTANLIVGNNKIAINHFAKTFYNKNKKLQKQIKTINPSASLNIIFMSDYNQFLIVENSIYNSTYFQLFVLENYNKNLFKPIILTPLAKVYKLIL